MELFSRQIGDPSSAVVAGDARANENIGLTAVQTLFVREHNRIVDALPDRLPDALKFAIARRVVGAEEQWITYTQFLPAMGVPIPRYRGYDESVDPSITDEFATVGYRAHSQIHGEFETDVPVDELGRGRDRSPRSAGRGGDGRRRRRRARHPAERGLRQPRSGAPDRPGPRAGRAGRRA